MLWGVTMRMMVCAFALLACGPTLAADEIAWPSTLPVYDHIVIVIEENKDVEQILGAELDAPYIRKLAAEGAVISQMFGEEHYSQGNYFWLFSGSNQNVGFSDQVPSAANHPNYPFTASNLGEQLIKKGLSFKGYSEGLPAIGSRSTLTHQIVREEAASMAASTSLGSASPTSPTARRSKLRPTCDSRTSQPTKHAADRCFRYSKPQSRYA